MATLRRKLESLLFYSKPLHLILCLHNGPKYVTKIAKEIDTTYSHTVKLLEKLKRMGLVEFEKKGRIKIVRLSPLGEKVAHELGRFLSRLDEV